MRIGAVGVRQIILFIIGSTNYTLKLEKLSSINRIKQQIITRNFRTISINIIVNKQLKTNKQTSQTYIR